MSKRSQATKTAVIYLRVSTKDQATRGGEAEGFSIPAQRQACLRKAKELGAAVVGEFVDAGESAKTADRHQLQKMMRYVDEHHPACVIVHKVDRFARQHDDAVLLGIRLREAGTHLVSATENIDDTPAGRLMGTMMFGIAQYHNDNLSLEVIKGTRQKVENGGTPCRAPLGYVNIGRIVNGSEARVVELDPDRAPHISWLFEQYATGEWSYQRLAEAVTARGLTVRPTKSRPESPVNHKQVRAILTNRYYAGRVTYQGVEYDGKHEPLVSEELFATVQDMIAARRQSSERPQKHWHHLTGTVKCGRCRSGLVFNAIHGRGGRYNYFTCIGRLTNRNGCDLPYLPVWQIDELVEQLWRSEQLEMGQVDDVRTGLLFSMADDRQRAQTEVKRLEQRVGQLKAERVKWAEAVMREAVPADVARDKQAQLTRDLATAEAARDQAAALASQQRQNVDIVTKLLGNCGQMYTDAEPQERRAYNQAWFERILIDDVDGQPAVVGAKRHEPFDSLHEVTSQSRATIRYPRDHRTVAPSRETAATGAGGLGDSLPRRDPCDPNDKRPDLRRGVDRNLVGSNVSTLAPAAGLEPATVRLTVGCSAN